MKTYRNEAFEKKQREMQEMAMADRYIVQLSDHYIKSFLLK